MLLALPLILLTACSIGSQRDLEPEDVATDRGYTYTGSGDDPSARWQRDVSPCPETMPTGGALPSEHEGVGSFFCDF
jgi:hypothetical protein